MEDQLSEMQRDDDETPKKPRQLTRRAALARLGLGAAVAYSAPTVLHLDRSANATIRPTPCPGKGKGKGSRWCRRQNRLHGRDRDGRTSRQRRRTPGRTPSRTPSRTQRPSRRGRN